MPQRVKITKIENEFTNFAWHKKQH